MRRFSFRRYADSAPVTRPKSQDSFERWEYRTFKEHPGGRWELVEKAKKPGTYRIRRKDLPKKEPKLPADDDVRRERSRFTERSKYREITEEAQTEFDRYYGMTGDEERERIEADAERQLAEYIDKASKGEEAEFPDLPQDMKAKFITAMFLLLRSKQIDRIKAPTEALAKQRDMVVAKVESKAISALSEVTEALKVKGTIERPVKPSVDPEEIFRNREIDVPPARMTDEEFADYMAQRGEKITPEIAARRPRMRDRSFSDLSEGIRNNANVISESFKKYRRNFGRYFKNDFENIEVRNMGSRYGFIVDGYEDSGNSVSSLVTLPISYMRYDDLAEAMNNAFKSLKRAGFKGRLSVESRPERIAMNKGTFKITCDDVKQAQAASEMVRKALGDSGITSRIGMLKKQFGMGEAEQLRYMSDLKRVALKSTSGGKFRLPSDKLEKYAIAARLRGYDLVPAGKLYGLRPHSSVSPIGQLELTNTADPAKFKKDLYRAFKAEQTGEHPKDAPEIAIDNPFERIQRDMDEMSEDFGGGNDIPTDEEYVDPEVEAIIKGNDEYVNSLGGDPGDPEEFIAATEKAAGDPTVVGAYGDAMRRRLDALDEGADDGVKEKIRRVRQKLEDVMNPDAVRDFRKVRGFEVLDVPKVMSLFDDESQIKNADGSPTGWFYAFDDKSSYIISADGKSIIRSGVGRNTLQEIAKNYNYKEGRKKRWLDSVDYWERDFDAPGYDSRRYLTNKKPDLSSVETFGRAGLDDTVLREIMGYKRLIYRNLTDEQRDEVAASGMDRYLRDNYSDEKVLSEFVKGMSADNYKDGGYEDAKLKVSKLRPSDFIKIICNIRGSSEGKRGGRRMISSMALNRIAGRITREAIGFPTVEALKKYMRLHPKADPKNHWVENHPGTVIAPKDKKYYNIPKSIGRGSDGMDITKTLLRSKEPNADGEYEWYDYKGNVVKDEDKLFRVNRLARELSILGSNMTNVRVFTDHRPKSTKPFAMAYLDKWDKTRGASPYKYFYTDIQAKDSNDRIMAKNIKFSKKFEKKLPEIRRDAKNGVPEAVVVHLIDKHHIRIGTKGQKNDGICTMRARFCTVAGDTIKIKNMPTKSGQKFNATIRDPILVREFKKRLDGKEKNDLVFGDTDSNKVNAYIKEKMGDKSFSSKNLRTCEATGIAYDTVLEMAGSVGEDGSWKPKDLSVDERYAVMVEACLRASKALNNTPDVCHSNYIDSRVFDVLSLPDNNYYKTSPIAGQRKDGSYIFKWEAKIEKAEAKLRKGLDDDEYNLYDKYTEARDAYLKKLNEDRRRDGWTEDLTRLPQIHATALLKKFEDMKKKGDK